MSLEHTACCVFGGLNPQILKFSEQVWRWRDIEMDYVEIITVLLRFPTALETCVCVSMGYNVSINIETIRDYFSSSALFFLTPSLPAVFGFIPVGSRCYAGAPVVSVLAVVSYFFGRCFSSRNKWHTVMLIYH